MRKILFIILCVIVLLPIKAQEERIAYFETDWNGNGPTVGVKFRVRKTATYTVKYPGSPLPERSFVVEEGKSPLAPATYDDGTGDIMPVVEVYGDADNLILIELTSAKVTYADVTKLTKLDSLSLAGNSLTNVDVSKNTQLKYLNLNSNRLVDLDLSQNPLLEVLSVGGNQLITLDLSRQTSLKQLEAYYTHLKEVKLATSSLTYLNVGYNPNLGKLETGKQENLQRLICDQIGLTELDMSLYPNLRELNCRSNALTSLNLSNTGFLTDVYCDNNQLTTLSVVENKIYANFNCAGNNLTFNTLPLPLENWVSYAYFPQNNIQLPATASVVDLSAEYDISGEYTTYVWKTVTGKELVAGQDYIISKGVTKFLKDQELPVYCELYNATFPGQESGTVKCLTTTRTNAVVDPTSIDTHESGIKIKAKNQQIIVQGGIGAHLDLYDVTGNLVVSSFLTNDISETEVPHKGIFILQLTLNGNKITQKVIL